MKCPFCNASDSKVIDSRPSDDSSSIRRRRQCEKCSKRFTTYEKVDTIPVIIVKKDNTREAYNRAKIEDGIVRSCHKRAVTGEEIKKAVDDIESAIFAIEEKEVPAIVVGELVMNRLKDLDEVAYVRFASVYREFKDVKTFMEEISNLLNQKKV